MPYASYFGYSLDEHMWSGCCVIIGYHDHTDHHYDSSGSHTSNSVGSVIDVSDTSELEDSWEDPEEAAEQNIRQKAITDEAEIWSENLLPFSMSIQMVLWIRM